MTDRPCPLEQCGATLGDHEVICRGCTNRTRTYLREVPAALTELDLAISRQTSMPPASGTGGCPDGCGHGQDDPACVAGVQLVLDARASEARTALVHVLMGWARVWDEETPVGPPIVGPRCDRRHWQNDEHASCRAIGRRATWHADRDHLMGTPTGQAALLRHVGIVGRPWAAEFAQEVAAAVEEAWRAVDRPPDSRIVGRCPQCAVALYAPEGSDTARCRNCGGTFAKADVREASLAESHHLLPVVQLAQAIEVHERTVRSWISRERLVRVRYGLDGKPLYRVSDGAALKARGESEEESA